MLGIYTGIACPDMKKVGQQYAHFWLVQCQCQTANQAVVNAFCLLCAKAVVRTPKEGLQGVFWGACSNIKSLTCRIRGARAATIAHMLTTFLSTGCTQPGEHYNLVEGPQPQGVKQLGLGSLVEGDRGVQIATGCNQEIRVMPGWQKL